jgi:hypothetical protein
MRRFLFRPLRSETQGLRKVSLVIQGQTLNFSYQPEAYSMPLHELIKTVNATDDGHFAALVASVCTLVKRWDMMKGRKPVRIKPSEVQSLPPFVLVAIVQAIANDANKWTKTP